MSRLLWYLFSTSLFSNRGKPSAMQAAFRIPDGMESAPAREWFTIAPICDKIAKICAMELIPLLYDNTYVNIDMDAILANFDAVQRKTRVPIMAIIKADAYGHGAVQVAPTAAYPQIIGLDIRPAIFCREDAQLLSREAVRQHTTAKFHLAVDTGMSRLGFQCTREDAAVCAEVARLPGLEAEGLFSHFATADCLDLRKARAQRRKFDAFYEWLKEEGITIPIRHMNNSAGLMNFDTQYDIVRSGIVTYGLYPSEEVSPALLPLKPALSWYSRVSHVKTLPAGREVSYGGTYVTERDTRIATVPVGYADGYWRSLSGKFYVLIRGRRAPILGRICMDQMMVDVTDIPGVLVGDTVTLVGTDGPETITVERIAQVAGTFNYEFICGISRRVPRFYYREGVLVREVHYLLDSIG